MIEFNVSIENDAEELFPKGFKAAAAALLSSLVQGKDKETVLPQAKIVARMLPEIVDMLPYMIPGKQELEAGIRSNVTELSMLAWTSDKATLLDMLGIDPRDILTTGLLSRETLEETYPLSRYEEIKGRLATEGVEPILAEMLASHKVMKDHVPPLADLYEAIVCSPEAPHDVEGAIRHYYTDVFPKMSYDDVIAQQMSELSCVPADKLQDLLVESLASLKIKDVAHIAQDVLNACPPEELAALVHDTVKTFRDIKVYLCCSAEDDVTSLPEPLVERLHDLQEGWGTLYKAVKRSFVELELPIMTHFHEVVEETRTRKQIQAMLSVKEAPTRPDTTVEPDSLDKKFELV